ncbi:MAG: class I SAM-dependent methyltransferase [Acidobacteriota bacterium]
MSNDVNTIYNEVCAAVYDDWFAAFDPAAIDRLAEFAGTGRALELGIGTGLIALPLARHGVEVCGIDASTAMVARLREKPGGDAISVTMGNFADVGVEGKFSLIFIVYNTLFALQTQKEQVRCFQNVSEHLTDGGVFVVEVFVPNFTFFKREQELKVTAVTSDRVGLKISQHDAVNQRIKSQHLVLINNQVKLFPVEIRYAYPAEMDLMARLAGLQLKHRWSDWQQNPFTSTSAKHISIYERRA